MPSAPTTDTAFRLGWAAGRSGQPKKACPYEVRTASAASWGEAWGMAVKVGRGKQNASPLCQQPTDCRASGDGLCNVCEMKRKHNDPEFAARHRARASAMRKAEWSDPVNRAKQTERLTARAQEQAANPKVRAHLSKKMKAKFKDREFAAANAERLKIARQTPAFKQGRSAAMKTMNEDPKLLRKRRQIMEAAGRWLTEDDRQKIALEVRDTADFYEVIGKRWNIGAQRVGDIAATYGVARGRKPKPPA